ncbi:MAG: glycosyltransferase family 39 protein [Eubacterium sp.]|nr:glycosyltransferase family 39 protein [Eubacterium sp.]
MGDSKKKRNFPACLYGLFFIFYTMMLLYACFSCVKTIYNPAYKNEYMLGLLFSGCTILFLWIAAQNLNQCSIRSEICMVVFLCVIAFVLRWMCIHILKTEQISDFANCNFAVKVFRGEVQDISAFNYCRDYYARYPSWFPYMRLVNFLYEYLCKGVVHTEAVKYANAILSVITCAGIYYAVRCYFKRSTAFVAGMLYACSPSMIIWTNVMSPDHITMWLFTLQAITWYWIWRKKDDRKACVVFIVLHSIVCALINWFKPLSLLFLLIFFCFLFGTYIKQEKRKYILVCAAYMLSFITCFIGFSKILDVWVESYIQQDSVDSTWTYIYSGITMNEDGTLDHRGSEKVLEIYETYGDLKEQQDILKKLAFKEIRENGIKLPLLLLNKYEDAVNSEGTTWFWANTNNQDGYAEKVDAVLGLQFFFTANGYYFLLLIFAVCSAISQMFLKYKNVYAYSAALTISGFISILVLSVAQSRYKLIIAPYFVMLSANGLETFMESLLGWFNKWKRMQRKENK